MKKLLVLIILIGGILCLNVKAEKLPPKTDHEKVTMYIFYGDWCGNCHRLIQYYLDNYKDEYKDYFTIKALEVQNKDNNVLSAKLAKKLNFDGGGIPVIVIGDFSQVGFGTDGAPLTKKALEFYKNKNYEDVAAKIIKDEELKIKVDTIDEAAIKCGLKTVTEKKHLSNGALIGITVTVLVLGAVGLAVIIKQH